MLCCIMYHVQCTHVQVTCCSLERVEYPGLVKAQLENLMEPLIVAPLKRTSSTIYLKCAKAIRQQKKTRHVDSIRDKATYQGYVEKEEEKNVCFTTLI